MPEKSETRHTEGVTPRGSSTPRASATRHLCLQILLLGVVSSGCGLTLDLYPAPDEVDGGVVRIDGGDFDASIDASFDALVRVDGPVVVDATLRDAADDAAATMDGATVDACECDPGERCAPDGCQLHYVGVTAGGAHTCAWTTVGSVVCWGDNEAGQLAAPAGDLSPEPRRVVLPGPVAQVEAGDRHTCARSAEGRVFCWGANDINQIAEGMDPTLPPTEVFLSGTAGQLSAGGQHTLAVRGENYEAWGANGQSQLGIGGVSRSSPPEVGDFEDPVAEVGAGGSHSCVLERTGGIFCVGARNHGQLANGEGEPSPDFVSVGLARGGFRGLSTAFDHTCAIGLADDAVRCWGSSLSGQSGRSPGTANTLGPIANSSPAQQVSAGLDHTCAVMMDNTVRCWGSNEDGQLGHEGSGGARPTNVPELARIVQVSAGRSHTCVLTAAGGILCFGDGRRGQLGSGLSASTTPLPVPDPLD